MNTEKHLSVAAEKISAAQYVIADAITEREQVKRTEGRTLEDKATIRDLRRLRVAAIELRNQIEELL